MDIAKDGGVSVDKVIKRFNRLKKNGVIRGTTVLIDPRRFGLECLSSLQVTAAQAHVSEVVDQIRAQSGVVFCTQSLGTPNIFAISVQPSLSDLGTLRGRIKSIPHVKEVKASIWVDDILLCPENFELERLKEETP